MDNAEIRKMAKEYVQGRRGEVWTALFISCVVSLPVTYVLDLILGIFEEMLLSHVGTFAGLFMRICFNAISAGAGGIATMILMPGVLICIENIWYGDKNGKFMDIFKTILPYDTLSADKDYHISVAKYMTLTQVKIFIWNLIPFAGAWISLVKKMTYAPMAYLIADGQDDIDDELFAKSVAIMEGGKMQLFKMYVHYFLWVLIPFAGIFIAAYKVPEMYVAVAGLIENRIEQWDGKY